jgi:hypothetical protein
MLVGIVQQAYEESLLCHDVYGPGISKSMKMRRLGRVAILQGQKV